MGRIENFLKTPPHLHLQSFQHQGNHFPGLDGKRSEAVLSFLKVAHLDGAVLGAQDPARSKSAQD